MPRSPITAQVFDVIPKECYGRGRRLATDAFNKVEGLPNIFAIGDTCIQTSDSKFPSSHPQVALQQGKSLAGNFKRLSQNKPLKPFIWVFIHLMSLVHYRNRILTLYNWVVTYFTKDQGLRMIIKPFTKKVSVSSRLYVSLKK